MTNTTTTPEYETPPPREQVPSIDWKPTTQGDEIIGTLDRRNTADTKFGVKEVIEFRDVELLIADGETIRVPEGHNVTLWPTPGALDAIAFGKCEINDRFGLKLVELVDTDKGNPFKRFGVAVIARNLTQPAPRVATEDVGF